MSETPAINYPQISVDPRGVLIPCSPEEFADFISSLLGKAQVCEGTFHGSFDIHIKDIENFYHLVDQRLNEQNAAQLVSFTVVIKYSDGTSVELPSLEHFRHHNEIRPVISTGVVLTWIYLIGFQNRPIPERQQIDVEIQTRQVEEGYLPFRIQKLRGDGIEYRISYTARTWGSDIENMLRSHIQTLINSETSNFFSRLMLRFRATVEFLLGVVIFIAGIGIGTALIQLITSRKYQRVQEELSLYNSSELSFIRKQIDILYQATFGTWSIYFWGGVLIYLGVLVMISVATPEVVLKRLRLSKPSFVNLTKSSDIHRQQALAAYKRGWLLFTGSIAVAIVTSIIGNVLTWIMLG
jgi:hypothetical protein